ncbi:PspC domain-containing protein [Rhodohalobacter barkolensis]|nr:PspC domain-containing protein [Rhodohalobacter barkolensis]
MSTKTSYTDASVQVSEKELQNTLQDFLEENEKKPTPSIWNIRTIAGLAMVFTAFAYIGHSVATEILGLGSLPFIGGLIQFMPYIGGALLGITLLTMFKKSGDKKKEKKADEEEQMKETYDKLDQFLYSEKERSSGKRRTKYSQNTVYSYSGENKLMKSRTDSKIAGVCGGLAKYLGMNSTVVRILFLVAFFMSSGTALLAYIAMSIVMPKEPISLMDDFN